MPFPLAPIIASVGSALVGGLIGRESARSQQARSEALQKEFAQHGIQWRVEDARAAGVHPVYALGGSGASSGGIPVMSDPLGESLARSGQDVSRALTAQQTDIQRAASLKQLELLSAQIGESDARRQLLLSQAARLNVAGNPPAFPEAIDPGTGIVGGGAGGAGSSITYQLPGSGRHGAENRFSFKPSEITSVNPNDVSSTAGPPGAHWSTYALDAGMYGERPLYIDLPAGASPTEAWESIGESAVLLGLVVKRNVQRYGQDWLIRFQQDYPELFERLGAVQRFRRRYGFGERDFSGSSNME